MHVFFQDLNVVYYLREKTFEGINTESCYQADPVIRQVFNFEAKND